MKELKLMLVILVILSISQGMYSPEHRRCILKKVKGIYTNRLNIERVPIIKQQYTYHPKHKYRQKLNYVHNTTILYNKYVAAGGSGEVYIVQLITKDKKGKIIKSEPKVAKRFFKTIKEKFQQENYIMHQLDNPISWAIQYNTEKQSQNSGIRIDSYQRNQRQSTIALYPYVPSVSWEQAVRQQQKYNLPMLLYKLCTSLQRTHSKGIIHNDIKLGNVLIMTPKQQDSMVFEVQLIDWNLSQFYFTGYSTYLKRGTLCLFSPQQLFRTSFVTPLTDLYSLGVTIFMALTDKMPYRYDCVRDNNNNIQTMISLAGIQNVSEMVYKYRYYLDLHMNIALKNSIAQPHFFRQSSLWQFIPKQKVQLFDDQLVDMLGMMLQADPQKRGTIQQILNHPYFDRVKRLPPMYLQKNRARGIPPKKRNKNLKRVNVAQTISQNKENQQIMQNKQQNVSEDLSKADLLTQTSEFL